MSAVLGRTIKIAERSMPVGRGASARRCSARSSGPGWSLRRGQTRPRLSTGSVRTGLGVLEGRGELVRVKRCNPDVVVGRDHHRGRIARPGANVVERRDRVKGWEFARLKVETRSLAEVGAASPGGSPPECEANPDPTLPVVWERRYARRTLADGPEPRTPRPSVLAVRELGMTYPTRARVEAVRSTAANDPKSSGNGCALAAGVSVYPTPSTPPLPWRTS